LITSRETGDHDREIGDHDARNGRSRWRETSDHDGVKRAITIGRNTHTDSIRSVMDALRRVVRDLRLSARDAERSAGISGAQLFVLQSLVEEPASSLNELAERTLTDQSSASVVVKRLADRKLVARKPSPIDARRIELSLTVAGKRLLARCPEPTQARLVRSLRRLSPGELSRLEVGLTALLREMRIENAPPRMFFDEEVGVTRTRARSTRRPA
jgi:DNA-binding MarR family transcriptional regulator